MKEIYRESARVNDRQLSVTAFYPAGEGDPYNLPALIHVEQWVKGDWEGAIEPTRDDWQMVTGYKTEARVIRLAVKAYDEAERAIVGWPEVPEGEGVRE